MLRKYRVCSRIKGFTQASSTVRLSVLCGSCFCILLLLTIISISVMRNMDPQWCWLVLTQSRGETGKISGIIRPSTDELGNSSVVRHMQIRQELHLLLLHYCDKTLARTSKEGKDLLWLRISEVVQPIMTGKVW